MFSFSGSTVSVRSDISESFRDLWANIAKPGPALTAKQRHAVLSGARGPTDDTPSPGTDLPHALFDLARTLYPTPGAVDGALVRSAADGSGDPATVEVIALTAMLAAVDGFHAALGVALEPLPDPHPGDPTGQITGGLVPRRTHVPMPRGAIPIALDLLPGVGAVFRSLFGPLYMTEAEMASPTFLREPGLDRAQMEVVSSRTSLLNECFY